MDDTKTVKKSIIYNCTFCNYSCSKKGHYNSHLLTAKHIRMTNDDINDDKKLEKKYICSCGKEYKNRQGLFKHKQKCDYKPTQEPTQNLTMIEPNINMFIDIIKENQVREPTVPLKPLPLSETNILLHINHSNNIKLFFKENG